MTTRPAASIVPTWATEDTYSSGEDTGLATKLVPTSGERAQGYHRKGRPPARKLNFQLNQIGQYLDYLIDVPLNNWGPWILEELDGTTDIDVTVPRVDGTVKPCWVPWAALWAIPGHVAGSFWVASESFVGPIATGVATPPGTGIALSTATRLLLIESFTGSAIPPRVLRSGANDLTTWAEINMAGVPAVSSTVLDAIVTSDGSILAGGLIDGVGRVWRSTDGGAVWAVSAALAWKPSRFLIGAEGRIFAWESDTAITTLRYSDDDGVTWTETASVGFDKIKDGVYLDAELTYVLSTDDGELLWATNPVDGPWTEAGNVTSIQVLAGHGGGAVCVAEITTNPYPVRLFTSDGGRTWIASGIVWEEAIGLACSETVLGEKQGQFCMVAEHNATEHKVAFSLAAASRGR